jgi:hypothetical protein
VPECLIHGLVMPRSGRTRVASRALRRSAAAMCGRHGGARWRWRGCAGWPWPVGRCRYGLGGVLGEGDIADVVQRLDAPVPSDPVGQARGMGLGGGEAGDRVHRHGASAAAAQGAHPTGDADRLGGVGEVQASHGGDLEAADLHACVPAVAGVVGDGMSRRRPPATPRPAWTSGRTCSHGPSSGRSRAGVRSLAARSSPSRPPSSSCSPTSPTPTAPTSASPKPDRAGWPASADGPHVGTPS